MTVTTEAAAQRLGVSQRQVQRLIASGELAAQRTAGDAWLVDALALNALSRSRPARGRPWSAETAWAALWSLSGLEADWLGTRTAARMRDRLEHLDTKTLVHACRRRATVYSYRASDSFLDGLRATITLTGASATTVADFEMPPDLTRVDGYCTPDTLTDLVTSSHLTRDDRGNVTLRVVDGPAEALLDGPAMPIGVVAIDLAESYEPRERSAGVRVLKRLLRQNLDT